MEQLDIFGGSAPVMEAPQVKEKQKVKALKEETVFIPPEGQTSVFDYIEDSVIHIRPMRNKKTMLEGESMKGKCISAGGTTTLKPEQEYFLFPAGPDHYYVSRFDNANAHFGCYQATRFQVVEEKKEEVSLEPPAITLHLQEGLYKARLIYRTEFYTLPFKEYFIKPGKTVGFFWHDREQKRLAGCWPLHWFTDFELIGQKEESNVHEDPEFVPEEQLVELLETDSGQLSFF